MIYRRTVLYMDDSYFDAVEKKVLQIASDHIGFGALLNHTLKFDLELLYQLLPLRLYYANVTVY